MKHKVKMNVLTEKRGLLGPRQVVERRTVTVDGKTYRRLMKEQRNQGPTAAERLAAEYLILEEEIAEHFER